MSYSSTFVFVSLVLGTTVLGHAFGLYSNAASPRQPNMVDQAERRLLLPKEQPKARQPDQTGNQMEVVEEPAQTKDQTGEREDLVGESNLKVAQEEEKKQRVVKGEGFGDMEERRRPLGRPTHSPDELPIDIQQWRKRVPILNVKHDFTFPEVTKSTEEGGEVLVEERPGVAMDTRPLSLRSPPSSVSAERLNGRCGGTFTALSGIISSPNYPFNYGNNIRCVYKVILPAAYTVGLDCNDMSIQPGDNDCENDFLAVSNNGEETEPTTKYCGDKAIAAFSTSSNMTLVFQSDLSYQYRGFMCRYRALNPDGTGADGTVSVNSTAEEHTTICTGPGDDGWAGKCGVSNWANTRIVGGSPVNEHQFPWMVAVLKECGKNMDQYCHICGGTVIHTKWILTGAHCVVSVPTEHLAMLLGDHNLYTLTPSQKFFRVEAMYVHPDFNVPSPLNNDVALAKLPQNMAFSKYIAPICLPPKSHVDLLNLLPRKIETTTPLTRMEDEIDALMTDDGGVEVATAAENRLLRREPRQASYAVIHDNFNGRNVTILGWGTISDAGDAAQQLREVSVAVLDNDVCDYYYGVMTDTMMCSSGDGGHGPCRGDSGSPAQIQMVDGRWLQVGVLAFGAAYGCEVGYPSGNVLLPVYVDWIEFVTGFDFGEYY